MKTQRLMLFALVAALPFVVVALGDDTPSKHDAAQEQAVREVVDKYFRGVVNADRSLLMEAWHTPGTHMMFVKSLGQPEPRFESVPIEQAMDWWTRVKAKSSSGKVLAVDIVENEMALVKFDFQYEHMHYVDYLTLLKLKDGWKIVNKSYVRIMPDKGAKQSEKDNDDTDRD